MFIDRYKFFSLTTLPKVILSTVLDRIKWNSKLTHSPPPLPRQIKDEAARNPKRAIFISKIWGGGWGKRSGINFQSLLSKIFYWWCCFPFVPEPA